MDPIILARIQFAANISFHILFPTITIALGWVLLAIGLLVMQRLFGLYLIHFPSYTLVYGAFAAVPIFLLWLYLSWIVVLLGAALAAVLPERDVHRRPLPIFPGRRLYAALLLLAELDASDAVADLPGHELDAAAR